MGGSDIEGVFFGSTICRRVGEGEVGRGAGPDQGDSRNLQEGPIYGVENEG